MYGELAKKHECAYFLVTLKSCSTQLNTNRSGSGSSRTGFYVKFCKAVNIYCNFEHYLPVGSLIINIAHWAT